MTQPNGLPLFRRRSGLYRRKSARIEQPFPPRLAGLVATGATGAAGEAREVFEQFLAAVAGVLYRYRATTEPQAVTVGSPLPLPLPADSAADGAAGERPPALPLVIDVAAGMPFERLLATAAAAVAAGWERSGRTLDELTRELGFEQVTNANPLFCVALRVAGWQPELPDLRNDVTMTVTPGQSVELEYNANVLDEATVARFGRHVTEFLALGLTRPELEVKDVDYLDPDERAQLIGAWSGGPVEDPDPRCLHHLFEEAAARWPAAEAIVDGGRTLSYRDLDERASRLANFLASYGVGTGSRVGLCLPAGADLLISVLAILKAGAAVVPLVPTFPVARNRMVIEDSAMEIAITVSSLGEMFAGTGTTALNLDELAARIDDQPGTGPRAAAEGPGKSNTAVGPGDAVYVLFTSGSTGRPKGVVLEHKTVVNLVLWQRDRGRDPAGQRTLQRTSIGFDVSFQEMFATLGFGGCLVVVPDEVRDDVSLLPGFIEQHAITRVFLPPVALDQMAVTANLAQRSLPTLKEVIVAGEQLRISMAMRRLFHQVECSLDNQYGPTETHVATGYVLTGPSTRWPEAPPIGTPVRNVKVYVLDPWLRPVPAGIPGEICVGGLAPARGYLNQAETEERFIADPFGPEGARLYRTGDRGRFLADGTIEFLGRPGDQVKIRGYRIELGEIEASLLRIPGIRQAAVTVHESPALGKQLAAYVVAERSASERSASVRPEGSASVRPEAGPAQPERPAQPDAGTIRRMLLDWLPDHMVPAMSGIVHTEALPMTPTGKVDRRALPPIPQAPGAAYAAAEGDTERTVAKLWAQTLGLESVGRDDSFMELGGHSLVGIEVVAQLNELYSIALPLRFLLQGTTVAALAAEIDSLRSKAAGEAGRASDGRQVPPLQEVALPDGRRIFCYQPAETQYLYLDVVGHRTYHRGGIRYPETGLVFDVGAHVGLFTLYALDQSPGLRVFAFEPCPPLVEALRKNTGNSPAVRLFPFGLGDRPGTAELTFYPNLTGMSSFHPDEEEERALLSRILENLGEMEDTRGAALLSASREYLDERLLTLSYTCERRTLSDVLAETGTEAVDLLKIDVQKSELEVLAGIAEADWPKIRQVAVELHDQDGRLDRIRSLLSGHGYNVTTEQDSLHAGTVVHFVYAVRE